MSDDPVDMDDPASEPTDAEVEQRASELARADGLSWAAPGTPEQGEDGGPGSATNDDRTRYRSLARERLRAERGLIID